MCTTTDALTQSKGFISAEQKVENLVHTSNSYCTIIPILETNITICPLPLDEQLAENFHKATCNSNHECSLNRMEKQN